MNSTLRALKQLGLTILIFEGLIVLGLPHTLWYWSIAEPYLVLTTGVVFAVVGFALWRLIIWIITAARS